MSFKQLTFSFIETYDFHLRVELKMKPNTVLRNILPLRKMVRFAVNKGYIPADPFASYKPIRGRSEHRFLTMEELKKSCQPTFIPISVTLPVICSYLPRLPAWLTPI